MTGLCFCKFFFFPIQNVFQFHDFTFSNISYRDDCKVCMKFRAQWEYIASQLKGRTNLAKIDILNDGISTGIRFDIAQVPTFIL